MRCVIENGIITYEEHTPYIPSIAELQTATEALIRNKTESLMLSIVSPYRQSERETWFKQVAAANKYLENPNVSVPILEKIIQNTDETLLEIATIISQADIAYETICGELLGNQRASLKSLYAENVTQEQIDEIRAFWSTI